MNWILLITGPILGAIIGYATNYVAVKLMFRPLKPIYIGRFHVPLTPGIIPRRKAHLGHAIGQAVGRTLLTPDDIERMLRSDVVKDTVCNETIKELEKAKNYHTLQELTTSLVGEERYLHTRDTLERFLLSKIISGVQKIDLEALLLSDGGASLKAQMHGTLLSLLITEETIRAVSKPLTTQLHLYLENNGETVLLPLIHEETEKLEAMNTGDLLERFGFDEERVRGLVLKAYENVVLKKIAEIVRQFDFEGTVETKINEMDVLELEHMLLSVMKKELNVLVRLGGYIGFVLGLITPLINMLA